MVNGSKEYSMNIKKIIFIANYAADYAGNFIESLNALECRIKEQGVRVIYIFPYAAQKKSDKWKVVGCTDSNTGGEYIFSDFGIHLYKTIKKEIEKDCIIHTHFCRAQEIVAVRLATIGVNCKIICHMHNRYTAADNSLKKMIRQAIYGKVFFIGVSQAVYEDITEIFSQKRCFCIKNAISLERLKSKAISEYDYHNRDNKKKVVIFGTNFEGKGVDLAIKAIGKNPYRKELLLVVIAHNIKNVYEKINALFPEYLQYVEVQPTIRDIQNLYNGAMLFISPSRSEAFGYAVVEAAYCKCQVIASDVQGQNTLKDIPYIQWVNKEDWVALSDAITECYQKMKDKEKLTNEKEETQKYIRQNYDLDTWCDSVMEVYEKL